MEELKKIAKQIKEHKVVIELTVVEAIELRSVLERNLIEMGIPTEKADENECPKCGMPIYEGGYYCPRCGQRVAFNKTNVIPL